MHRAWHLALPAIISMEFFSANIISNGLLAALMLSATVLAAYYLLLFSRLAFHKTRKQKSTTAPVSVIICARNELNNLRKNLHSVLKQNYQSYYVHVVNDCSWDQSEKALEEFADAFPHLKVVTIREQERYRHGKKFALSLGIKSASTETILLTDADCKPASENWVSLMAGNIDDTHKIVIGYGAYEKKTGLLNKWIRFDTFFNAMQYLSYAIAGNPYMGTGRNLAYTKALFFKNKGFAKHNHILSGDDDLFINEVADAKNTTVEFDPGSFTISDPEKSFAAWLKQKRRHMSTSPYYKIKHRILLGLFYAAHILFYVAFIALIIRSENLETALTIFSIKLIIQMIITGLCARKLRESDLLIFTPVFDLMIVVIYPILAISNLFIKVKAWK